MALLVALLVAANAEAVSPSVTIPLPRWEEIRAREERPSLTVVELLRVEGSFASRDLAISFAGRGAGHLPRVDVLQGGGFRLFACEGDALLSRAEGGGFALTPLSPRFHARCRVALDGSDRLEAQATASVLEVASSVRDGDLVASDGDGGRAFSIVRRIAAAPADLPPSVAGRYRVTLLPEETRFRYHLEVRNPNRARRQLELALRDAEHVEAVDARVPFEVAGGRYRFDLPPGESTIELAGRLTGESFAPPVAASLQYLLVESHPLIRPEVRTGAKRVGIGEVGLEPEYRGAQAFLLDGGGEVSWKAVRLEALRTAGFAVQSLSQVFFLAADGTVRGQADLRVDNQGAPALSLGIDGEPTFASVAGEPAFLTRDEQGRLFLPLSQGAQRVSVQDRRPFAARLGLALARLELPQVGVPASRATVELRYPAEWIPVYEELSPSARLHLLEPEEALLLATLALAAERLLALLGLRRSRRLLLAGATVLAAAFSKAVLAAALALSGGALALVLAGWVAARLRGVRLAAALAGGAIGLIVAAGIVSGLLVRVEERGSVAVSNLMKLAEPGEGMIVADVRRSKGVGDAEVAAAPPRAEPNAARYYQGLPARVDLPEGARRSVFGREMLASDGPRHATVVLVAARLVGALGWASLLAALAIGIAFRRDLSGGARALASRPRPPAPAAT